MEEILNQLKAYCESCSLNIDYSNVVEAINLISSLTCWNINGCETFLNEDRSEFIELCDNIKVFEFLPYYLPFDENSFTFKLIVDTEEGQIEKDIENIKYDSYRQKFIIPLDLDKTNRCGYKYKYGLYVTYVAGYELIPDCMLPVMCDILQLIADKKSCDCEACNASSDPDSAIRYPSGDYISAKLQMRLSDMLVNKYYDMLGRISLCKNVNLKDKLWGMEFRKLC